MFLTFPHPAIQTISTKHLLFLILFLLFYANALENTKSQTSFYNPSPEGLHSPAKLCKDQFCKGVALSSLSKHGCREAKKSMGNAMPKGFLKNRESLGAARGIQIANEALQLETEMHHPTQKTILHARILFYSFILCMYRFFYGIRVQHFLLYLCTALSNKQLII